MDSQPITHKYGWDQPASRTPMLTWELTTLAVVVAAVFGAFSLWISSVEGTATKLSHSNTTLVSRVNRLSALVKQLDYACMPADTGGGVTQCQQPNILQAPPSK